jgi:hypothetical protein
MAPEVRYMHSHSLVFDQNNASAEISFDEPRKLMEEASRGDSMVRGCT